MVIPAINYIVNGYSIIPLSRTSKRPLIGWKKYQKEKADILTAMQWFRGKANNIAIICGEVSGNLLILDFDDPEYYKENAMLLTDFPVIKTRRGYHVYLKTDSATAYTNRKLVIKNGKVRVELRAGGGYAAAPPSVHSDGLYHVIHNSIHHIEPISKDRLSSILEEIAGKSVPEYKHIELEYKRPRNGYGEIVEVSTADYYVRNELESNISAIKNSACGNRNNQLFLSACFIGRLVPNGYLDLNDTASKLLEAAIENGLVSEDGLESTLNTINSGLSRGMKQPIKLIEDDILEGIQ